MSEQDRLKQLGQAKDVRRDIQETLGTDIVEQYKLSQIAEKIWLAVPVSQRPSFTAEDWQRAIYEKCTASLQRAERHLQENKTDEKLFVAKVKILRATFSNQVVRAMQEISDKYRTK